MMVSDDKKAKATPAPKDPAPKKEEAAKSTPEAVPSKPEAVPSKPEGADKAAAAPASYSRGEGQKPVTQAYKENWNAIFAKKTKTKTTKNKKRQKKQR